MRVLFFNEGNLGTHVMGQGQLDGALHTGLPYAPSVQARFAGLTPMNGLTNAVAARSIEPLAGASLDFRTLRWHMVQSLRASNALQRELRAWPADVVHVHSHSVALTMGAAMRAVPITLSVDATVRDWWSMPAWPLPQRYAAITIAPSARLERRAFERAALVFAWTAWTRRGVERSAPGARVVEHHPGIDLDRYRPATRRKRERPRVLFIGGRFAEKGGLDLLDALDDRLGETVELDLVTPEPIAERPGLRVHRLSPSDPHLLDLRQQADVLCLPTHGDAVPWAVLEAMACGTPVISTRIGGIPDLLDGGRAGLLVDRGDRRGLRDALEALLSDPSRRAALAARARERCGQRYDACKQFPRMIEHLGEFVVPPLKPPMPRPAASQLSPQKAIHDHATWPRRSTVRTSSTRKARSPNSSAG